MEHAGGATRVVAGSEGLAEREIAHRPGQDEHLLHVIVHGRAHRRRVNTWLPPEDAGQCPAVGVAREDSLERAGKLGDPLPGNAACIEELERRLWHAPEMITRSGELAREK